MIEKQFMPRQHGGNLVWVEWMLAMAAGYTLGILGILPWVVQLAYAGQTELVSSLVGGAVLGSAVGGAQWLVLRRHARRVDGWWVLASIAGGMLGLALGTVLADMLAQLPLGQQPEKPSCERPHCAWGCKPA